MGDVMEDFQRPNHADFMDSSELKKKEFSGLRHNSLSDEAEVWIRGEVVKRVTRAEVAINPLAINRAFEEAFGLPEIMPDTPAAKAYVKQRDSH